MISSIPPLVNTFANYLSKNDYVSAHSFAVKNNLLFSHINEQGKSCASYIHNILHPYIRQYGSKPDQKIISYITPLLDYFLEKEPQYWYYKHTNVDNKNEPFLFLLSYMVFNNTDKVKYFLSNMYEDSVNITTLKKHYFTNAQIDFNMVGLIEQVLMPKKISLVDLISVHNKYPLKFKDTLANYDTQRNTISYKNTEAIKLFKHIFDKRLDKTPEIFIETLDKTIEFLKPLLIKSCKINYPEEKTIRYIAIFKKVFEESINNNISHDYVFDKSFVVPGLKVLQKHFPETPINSYLTRNYLQINTLSSLSINKDWNQPEFDHIQYDPQLLDKPQYVFNLNKEHMRVIIHQYIYNYFTYLFVNELNSNSMKEDISLKHERIEDYRFSFPEQFKEDFNNFKKALDLLHLPLKSADPEITSYLQYLNLDTNIDNKNNVKVKKIKI